MHVFISYARRDQTSITRLRADFEQLGYQVWFDRESHGGQEWWDDVVHHVRGCMVFVFALSPDSLRSKACLAELRYALALRKAVLPVVVRDIEQSAVPAELAGSGFVDYLNRTPETVISLRKTFNALPGAKALPARLPKEPEIPTSYLNAYLDRIDAADLDEGAQRDLFEQLRARLANEDERAEVWDLLVRLRPRVDDAAVVEEIEELLAPGWQPDPRQRFEARFWDGQSWTTLVWQHGRQFNDRSQPPKVHARLPRREVSATADTAEVPTVTQHQRVRDVDESRGRSLPWLVGAGVALVAGGVTGGILIFGGGSDPGAATRTARNFVDAVNTHDQAAVQNFVCGKDLVENAHLYGAFFDTGTLTLERVDAGGADPRFTVLADRTVGNSSVRLSIPLTEENGEWRVCDISRALSGR
ncbi:toll/interleukin-1 receptor domain-containing protein [Actinokineospora sp.]|uniref:toll/interleukin-1 receptor domain-containing protein n=1 Tax=Actinokineospora sp. TaxID=1872133 RepID=UPI0040381850